MSKIKFNRSTAEFERDGTTLRVNSDGAFSIVGWMRSVASRSPMVAKELESFANFQMDIAGKPYSHEKFFEPAEVVEK